MRRPENQPFVMSERMLKYFWFKSTLILVFYPNSSVSKNTISLRKFNVAQATFCLFVCLLNKATNRRLVASKIFRLFPSAAGDQDEK